MTIIERIQRPNRQPVLQESSSKVKRRDHQDDAYPQDDRTSVQMLAGVLAIVAGVGLLLAGLGVWHFIAKAVQ